MKKWLIIVLSLVVLLVAIGFILKKSSGVQPIGNFLKISKSQNTCLTNEAYSEVTDPNAPVLSMPFDINDYSTKHWGMVPFCAKIGTGMLHGAFDFELKPDTKVYSTIDGVVDKAYVGKEEGSGEIISIKGDGFTVDYSGLTNLQFKVGDKVSRGDYIADSVQIPHGEYHVHLGVTINGKQECPLKYMDEQFLAATKQMYGQANYGSQTDAPCLCNCESLTPSY